MKDFLKNPFFRFILVGTGLYLSWYLLYEYYLNPHTNLDEYIINSLVNISEWVLRFFGYDIISYEEQLFRNRIGIAGTLGVLIGEPCDGFVLFALFFSFIMAFPGSVKHKFWYIPVGLIFIHLINAVRVAALAIIVSVNQNWLSFNHDYTFTVIVYGFVFLLWWIWVNKFSPLRKQKPFSAS